MRIMSNELLSGKIFELGPDGYGYILDSKEPGRSYAFRLDQITGFSRAAAGPADLEGLVVSFRLSTDGHVQQVSLDSAHGVRVKGQ
jgi:hypothetical protein